MFDGDPELKIWSEIWGPALKTLAAQKHENFGAISKNFATWLRDLRNVTSYHQTKIQHGGSKMPYFYFMIILVNLVPL